MNDLSDTDDANGDGEGVWSPDIEQCFREALLLFPPCGRRKHILQEEGGGKMYGRNELIARHIRMRTGKIRTRKQVSSHIQVLARRKAKTETSKSLGDDPETSSQSSPTTVMYNNNMHGQHFSENTNQRSNQQQQQQILNQHLDVWFDRPITTKKIRLVDFSAFIEYRRQLQAQVSLPISLNANLHPSTLSIASLGSATPSENIQSNNINSVKSLQPDLIGTPSSYVKETHSLSQSNIPSVQVNSNSIFTGQPIHHSDVSYEHGTLSNHLQQPLNNNQQHHQQINQQTSDSEYMFSTGIGPIALNHQQQTPLTSAGFTRHSYVKINYRQPIASLPNKLERIDISQIQDKFPEIIGSEGLFQRGPSDAFFLVKFWADMNNDYEYNIEDQNSYFGFSCSFETVEAFKDITCSTKACSYGLQVVEKVEKIHGALNNSNGRFSYEIDRSPMCEFMIQFIKKLRQLPRASQMNSVLENFSVLQVVTSESTSEILLCLAYVFEIAPGVQHNGSQYNVYKLTKD